MYLKDHDFNHEAESIEQSLNVPKEVYQEAREAIFFGIFSNALDCRKFGDRDSAPRQYTTKTGDLQRILQNVTDERVYSLVLYMFTGMVKIAIEAFGTWESLEDDEHMPAAMKSQLSRIRKIIAALNNARMEEEGMDRINLIDTETMITRIKLVERSEGDFSKYMSLLKAEFSKPLSTEEEAEVPDLEDPDHVNAYLDKLLEQKKKS